MTPRRTKRTVRPDPVADRYARFADAYVAGGNVSASAEAAGYSPKTAPSQGSRLLKNVKVQALIAERQARLKAKFEVKADTVVEELVRIGMADIRDVVSWGPTGLTMKESSEISDAAARAIASVKMDAEGRIEVKLHPKAPALEALSKHLGLYKDPLERGLQGLADAIREARQRAAQRG